MPQPTKKKRPLNVHMGLPPIRGALPPSIGVNPKEGINVTSARTDDLRSVVDRIHETIVRNRRLMAKYPNFPRVATFYVNNQNGSFFVSSSEGDLFVVLLEMICLKSRDNIVRPTVHAGRFGTDGIEVYFDQSVREIFAIVPQVTHSVPLRWSVRAYHASVEQLIKFYTYLYEQLQDVDDGGLEEPLVAF